MSQTFYRWYVGDRVHCRASHVNLAPVAHPTMSSETATPDPEYSPQQIADLEAEVKQLREEVADLRETVDNDVSKMSIIATKGTLDMAYPPLILASTAAAFGWNVTLFHTFWALDILHEEKMDNLKMSSTGQPAMPVPNIIAILPGMDRMTTWMMNRQIDDVGTASVNELVDTCLEAGVEIQACQMTQELMGYADDDFYDGVTTGVGAAAAIDEMADADIQLLI